MTEPLFTASILVASLPIGLIPVLLDGVKPTMQTRLNLSERHADWYLRVFYFSWLPAMPLAGLLIDHVQGFHREIVFLALFALILGMAWLALARSFGWLLVNGIVIGVAYSFLTVAVVRLMTLVFFPHYRPNAVAGLNIGFIAVGFGAMIAPALVYGIERWWGYRQGLLYISIGLIGPAALIAYNDRSLFPDVAAHVVPWEALLTPNLAMVAALLLVYFVVENGLDYWPRQYLLELRYEERWLVGAMLVFWLAFLALRGATAWWLMGHPHHVVGAALLFAFLSALVLGNLVSGFELGTGTLGFWLLGACYGPLLPCLLGIAVGQDGRSLPTSLLGVLLALSGLDTLLVRPVIWGFAKDRPARVVMRVPTVLALLMTAPLVLMLFLR